MNLLRNRFRPRLEHLESRDTPSNLTVAFADNTLTIKGATDNKLTIEGNASDATQFTIASSGSDTFNGNPSPYSSPSGVHNMTFTLTGDTDEVDFDDAVRNIVLEGSLSINTGAGANEVLATDLTVEKNISITNGTNATGLTTENYFYNLDVGGNLTITGNSDDADTDIVRASAGLSSIVGNVSISNGSGAVYNSIIDTNIGGNFTSASKHANSKGAAGYTEIYNYYNTSFPSVIKGNVSVSYVNGTVDYDGIWDTVVEGNVTFNHGTGAATTNFDGFEVDVPVEIGGNLTMTGTGVNTVTVGTEYLKTGLIVGKDLSITSGVGDNTLDFNRLQVTGTTKLKLGNGANTVTIDQSVFAGTFNLTTGTGGTDLDIECTGGDTTATVFNKSVVIALGDGMNYVYIALEYYVISLSTFDITGAGLSYIIAPINIIFPFGGAIDFT